MQKLAICLYIFCFSFIKVAAQTTDLSIVVEAQNISGISVSQVNIYQDYQYIITIINSGNPVNNATFSQTLSANVNYYNATSQNPTGGASNVSNLTFTGNELAGTIANLPSNSSVEVLVSVRAPIIPGGIATNVIVVSPNGTTDNNTSNNQSIISIDVNDIPIDFSVTYSQITPPQGTGIGNWNDIVTYQFTITNNTNVSFPLASFNGRMQLANASSFGYPNVAFETITCIGGTNGMQCPDVSIVPQFNSEVFTANPDSTVFFEYDDSIEFNANSALIFEITYKYLDPNCSLDIAPLAVNSFIEIDINHINQSPNVSNSVFIQLIETTECSVTDLCIETTQINPLPSQVVNWDEEVTFETIACNNGPLDAYGRFFLQNLSGNIDWNIVSITCDATTGNITCNDFNLINQGVFWSSSEFIIPANVTITITTVLKFIDPDDCTTGPPTNSLGHVRSGINLLEPIIIESDITNNAESDYVILPALDPCDTSEVVDLQITKIQTDRYPTNNEDTAEVTILMTDVDIEVLKTVSPTESSIGETVIFTITASNIGTTNATNVSIYESLPIGYIYINSNVSYGTYNDATYLWTIPGLAPNQTEVLTISAQVISANNLLNTANLDSVTEIDRDETNNEGFAEVFVNNCLSISQGFSPNNDGNNDIFIINCIEDYPKNNVKIFNRNGTLVYETNNYKNNWNGKPNRGTPKSNTLLPVGTYYYIITIDTIQNPFVGWLYLNY